MSARTIPILPCTSIDATIAFDEALGFAVGYRQERPNTYAAVARGDIELQFSKGDTEAAERVLVLAMADDPDAAARVLVRAWILRADLAYRAGREAEAAAWLEEARRTALSDEEPAGLADDLRRAADLEASLTRLPS
jgi:hypothetical protein